VTWLDHKLRYQVLIRAVAQSYLSLAVSTILNIYTVRTTFKIQISWSFSNMDLSSNIPAVLGCLLIVYIPVKCYNILFRTCNPKNKEFQKRYKTIILDLRTDDPLRFQFITVFFFRRAIYASTFMLLAELQIMQVSAAVATVIGMTSYLLLVRPYKSVLSSVLSVFNEFMLFLTVGLPGRFLEPVISPSESRTFGTILIGIIISTIAVNWIGIMIYGIVVFIKRKLKKKAKNAQIKEKSKKDDAHNISMLIQHER
jgi:hypothetical protein